MNKLLERRLEFLKLEGIGFSLCEIVKLLSKKYRKSERMIYYDAETRGTWQPTLTQLFDLEKARLIVMNRYETIYREAAFMMKQGDSKNKPSALRIMLDAINDEVNLLGISSLARENLNRERMKHFDDLMKILDHLTPELNLAAKQKVTAR